MGSIVPDEQYGYRCISCEDYGYAWWLCLHMGEQEQQARAKADAQRMTIFDLTEQSNAFAKRHADLNSTWSPVDMIRWRAIEAEWDSRRFERNGEHYIRISGKTS